MNRIARGSIHSTMTCLALILALPALAPAQNAAPLPAPQGAVAEENAGPGPARPGTAGQASVGPTMPNDAVIQYDPATDSIVVIADEQTNQNIAQVIQALDQPIPQVLIKVLFLEVTHSNNVDLGVQSSLGIGGKKDASGSRENNLDTDFGLLQQFVDSSSGKPLPTNLSVPTTPSGSYRVLNSNIDVVLRALQTEGKLDVLSRPSVLACNNQTADVTVGQEIPFITNTQVTDTGNTLNTVQYKNIGIILDVTPRISPDGLVAMDVEPQISTLTGDTVPISSTVSARVIAMRSASTHVVVADGKTVVIGGLMEDNNTATIQKVPVLGSIPVMGWLFRHTVTEKDKTELIIFLTPYVVTTPKQVQTLSTSENNRAEVPQTTFTPQEYDKFVDNLPGAKPWKGKP